MAMYEMTCDVARLEPPLQQLLPAMVGNQHAMDGFVQMNAGTISPAAFLSPENVGAIMSAARLESA